MKTAVVMNQHAWAGREYSAALAAAGIAHHVIEIGSYPAVDSVEDERCEGMWQPPVLGHAPLITRHAFDSLKSEALHTFLQEEQFDLGIQGGTGILREVVFGSFRLGMLNFHPGDLPAYRGCSAPEWQLANGDPVVITCHLVDDGIDTGRILAKRTFSAGGKTYAEIRAGLYPFTAGFVAEMVSAIKDNGNEFPSQPLVQDESLATYRQFIGEERILELRAHGPF